MSIESAIKKEYIPFRLHTWIGERFRVSSLYRESSSVYNPSWYWETMVFSVSEDEVDETGNRKQQIVENEESFSLEHAANLHAEFYEKYKYW